MNADDRPYRPRALARLALFLLLWIAAAPSGPAGAQTPDAPGTSDAAETAPAADVPAPPDPSQPMGPPDAFNRGTPRGAMYGYLTAARSGDYERAAQYLDLRQLPSEEQDRSADLARHLKVVLDQTLWVDVVNLSDTNDGASGDDLAPWQDLIGEIETASGPVQVLMQRVPREGDGVRIWKVSAETVERIPDLYAEFEPVWLEGVLPRFLFELEILDVALWKWLSLVGLLVVASLVSLLIAGTATRLLGRLLSRTHERFDDRIVHHFRGPMRLALTVSFFAAGHRSLGLALNFAGALHGIERALSFLAVLWFAFRLIDLAALTYRLRAESRGNLGVIPILLPVARFSKLALVLFGALVFVGAMGVDVTAAVAGLGVGGIAVALAAQKSIENLFGGVTLFADRPVKVGDYFRYGDQMGTVEEIGLRSTRIRTLDRTLVTIPNAEFSNLALENFAKRDRMRLYTLIGVRYETTPDQLRVLLAGLRRILIAHPRVTDDPARVRFVGFGAYSLDIEVFAYVDTNDWSEFLGIREDVYLRFMDAVKEAGTGFAFPSSTTYLGRDEAPSAESQRRAEQQVAEWREQGELPFPNYPDTRRREVENSLPWPPKGSAPS